MDFENIYRQTAKILLKIESVSFRFNPPYKFTSGLKSPVYLDNRLVMSYPLQRRKIVGFYIDVIEKKIGRGNVDLISATATAAIPQGAWVADKLELPMVYVRPTTKSYGKGKQIEGILKKGSKVVIIEDHISTAVSVIENLKAIRKAGGKVSYCIATTTYEAEESIRLLKSNKLKLFTLTTGKMIVEEAFKAGKLTSKEKEKVDLWFNDPVNWAKRIGV